MSRIWKRNKREVTDWEGGVLEKYAAMTQPPHVIVEIGSYRGRSTIFLLRSSTALVYAVDLWLYHPRNKGYRAKETKDHFDRAVLPFRDRVRPLMMDSVQAVRKVDGPIGLLFIDGNHSKHSVMLDCLSWEKKVVGTIIFHDYHMKGVRSGIRNGLSNAWRKERISKRLCIATRK